MARIKLLNSGGYSGFENVRFPVEVEGTEYKSENGSALGYDVAISELTNIGFKIPAGNEELKPSDELYWGFCFGEVEVVNHE